jgi:hypothetical protein
VNIGDLAEDSSAREALENAAEAVYVDLVDLRQATASVLGANYTRKLGYAGNTPDDPVAVERLGRLVLVQRPPEVVPPLGLKLVSTSPNCAGFTSRHLEGRDGILQKEEKEVFTGQG